MTLTITGGPGINGQIFDPTSVSSFPTAIDDRRASIEFPSAFELLFSRQIGTVTSSSDLDQGDVKGSVAHNEVHYESSESNSHAIRRKSTSNSEITDVVPLVTTLPFQPVLLSKDVMIRSSLPGPSSFDFGRDVAPTNSNPSSLTISDSTGKSSPVAPQREDQLSPSISKSDDSQLKIADTTVVDAPALTHDVIPALRATSSFMTNLSNAAFMTETIRIDSGKGAKPESSCHQISPGDNEVNSVLRFAVVGPDHDYSRDESVGDSKPALTTPTSELIVPQHSMRKTNGDHQSNSVIIPAANPVRSATTMVRVAISDQLATAITQQLDHESIGSPISVRIRLDRPGLGSVNLHLSIANDVVSVRIIAQDQLTKQIIEGQMNDLRQSLNTSGVNCGQFQVACDSSDQRSFHQGESVPESLLPASPVSSRWGRPPSAANPSPRRHGEINVTA